MIRSRSAPAKPAPTLDEPAVQGPALAIEDLSVAFPSPVGGASLEVVKGVSFALPVGQMLGVVGESGSGKTMTALAIAQLTPYPGRVSGRITLHDRDLSTLSRGERSRMLGRHIGFVFQNPMASLNPALTLGRMLVERARLHRGMKLKPAIKASIAMLEEVRMPAAKTQMNRYPHELSGGMQQRAMIALALISEPTVLICDEPTTALDVTIQAQVMDLLCDINRDRGTAIIFISHNLALTVQNCDRILVMYAGRIVEELQREQLLNDPRHPYTKALLSTLPVVGQSPDEQFVPIPGEPPDIATLPGGCAFNPRCLDVVERCRNERPPLVSSGARSVACWRADHD